jgi:hypothetical protein
VHDFSTYQPILAEGRDEERKEGRTEGRITPLQNMILR